MFFLWLTNKKTVKIEQKTVKCQSIATAFNVLTKNEDINIESIVASELTETYFVKNKVNEKTARPIKKHHGA